MMTLANGKIMRLDLSRRSTDAEWLDNADMNPTELELVLRDLARFNGALLGHQPIIAWLRRAIKDIAKDQRLTLIDVGCGYGDLLREIRRWARRHGRPVKLIGIDLSRETVAIARAATDDADYIDYQVADVFEFDATAPIDFVVSSLLTHHLSDRMIVEFLRWMENTARKGWLIYDLQRHIAPYFFIGLMGRLMRVHPIVIHDGQISVTRSLTRAEWSERIASAGIPHRSVQLRWFLYRFVIGRLR